MDEVTAGFVGVLVGAAVSTLVPAAVEAVKGLTARKRLIRDAKRERVSGLTKAFSQLQYLRVNASDSEHPEAKFALLDAIDGWSLLSPRPKIHDDVIDLVGHAFEAAPPIVHMAGRGVRGVLPHWAVGGLSDAKAQERIKLTLLEIQLTLELAEAKRSAAESDMTSGD